MISVIKPNAPEILLTKGVAATQKACAAYEAAAKDYQTGVQHSNWLRNPAANKSHRCAPTCPDPSCDSTVRSLPAPAPPRSGPLRERREYSPAHGKEAVALVIDAH